jgi:hypothetical protein
MPRMINKAVQPIRLRRQPSSHAEEARLAYGTPNPEFDDLERHCARLPKRRPRE